MKKSRPYYQKDVDGTPRSNLNCYDCHQKIIGEKVSLKIGSKIRQLCVKCAPYYM